MSKRVGFEKSFLEEQQEDAIAGRQILSPTIKVGEEEVALHDDTSAKEKIQKFEAFLRQSPLLGNNLENNLAKEALEFALHYTFSHPEIINKVITLITEQNPNNPAIKKAVAQRLVEFNNNNASELSASLNIEDHIKELDPKNKGSQLSSLSSRNKTHIRNIAVKSADKERLLSGDFSEDEFKSFHSSYQAVQNEWNKVPAAIRPSIISGVIVSTDRYFDKQAKSGDLKAIKDMVAIASKSKAFMEYRDYKDQNNLEERLVLAAAGHIIGSFTNPINEIDTEKLNKFSEFLDKGPVLGRDPVNSPASLGKIAIEVALEHVESHPDLLKKVTALVIKQNKNNPQAIEEFKTKLENENKSNSRTAGQKNSIEDVLKELNKPKISRGDKIKAFFKSFNFSFPKMKSFFAQLFSKKEKSQKPPVDPMILESRKKTKEVKKAAQERIAAAKKMSSHGKKERMWGNLTGNSARVITAVNDHQKQREGIKSAPDRNHLSKEEQLNLVKMEAKNRLEENKQPKPKKFRPTKMAKKVGAFISKQVNSVSPASVVPESVSPEGSISSRVVNKVVDTSPETTKPKKFRPAKMAKKVQKMFSMDGGSHHVTAASPPSITPVSRDKKLPKKRSGIF